MDISGKSGQFKVHVIQHPRYVDMNKCLACGLCAQKCPKKVDNEYDEGLSKRKAIYVKYAQAVPLKYAIDPNNCVYFEKGKGRACEKFCPSKAINFDDKEKDLIFNVGAIIVAAGCEAYDPGAHDVYGYRKSPNIVTSLQFERMLSPSGPYQGRLVTPSNNKKPEKIAWLQCVGSRDSHIGARNYCSSLCCTQAIKEAMVAKEHCKNMLDTAIFYIDVRTHGKYYERYYRKGKNEIGIRFIKTRITNIIRMNNERLLICYVNEAGKRVDEEFDIVVLSVGIGVSQDTIDLAGRLGIELDHFNFATVSSFEPTRTSVPGIFVSGTFEAPKDIPGSIIESSAAAGVAGSTLSESRWTLTKVKEIPKEIDVRGESIRTGIFVCRCGVNIASIVDVASVVEYAKTLPGVVYAEDNMFSCSQDTQAKITQAIKDENLNRLVVAACTPKTHESLFQETATNAGLNKYLFEMANIRNQCSWVHAEFPEDATEKAKDLVRMAVARVSLQEPLIEPSIEINQSVLVIGGGVAGIIAAKTLTEQGYHTYLVEKSEQLGGHARRMYRTWRGDDVREHLSTLLIDEVLAHEKIDVRLNTEIKNVEGFVGNFETTVCTNGKEEVLKHGVAIIATGASEFKPDKYLYGLNPHVLTGLELDQMLIENSRRLKSISSIAFIQCVGSRNEERPYCSKICCSHSVKNAINLKKLNPEIDVFIIYRQLRTYGLREDMYRQAREMGVHFLRYDYDKQLSVEKDGKNLVVEFTDTVIKRKMAIHADFVVLATAIIAPKENPLANMFKLTLDEDGFIEEAHVKLRPVDCTTDGVFICGLAHAPKPLNESIAQAQAAATRAITLLAKSTLQTSGTVAQVNSVFCSGCGVCVKICPYSALSFIEKGPFTGRASVNQILCKGCGLCVASCRSGAINLKGFGTDQIMAMINEI